MLACSLALAGATLVVPPASAEPATRVFLNGVPSPVFFNDGDSFRVLAGRYAGSKARLAGFNTLESYGAVHQWGDFHAKELYVLAKMSTLNARRGVWHCTSDMKTDTYGRTLWDCPDLARDHLRRGVAHVMAVGKPARPDYLEAQREAIEHRRGIWSHGIPDFILTSLHSVDERSGTKPTYNRLISTRDGGSRLMRHTYLYKECDKICHAPAKVDPAGVRAVVAELRANPKVKETVDAYGEDELIKLVTGYARLQTLDGLKDDAHAWALLPLLQPAREAGRLGRLMPSKGSCMVYVDFRRRFGNAKAACLK